MLSVYEARPAVAKGRQHYLQTYEALLDVVLRTTREAYDRAYANYLELPVEQDAFATQNLVERGLAAKLNT